MKPWYRETFLHIPKIVWALQFLYVAIALLILFFIYSKTHKKTDVVFYVLVMIVIDVIWRLAIRNKFR